MKNQRSKQGVNPKVVKGPLIDSCADIPVVPASFKSKLSNLRPISGVRIDGITGTVQPTEQGDYKVGPFTVHGAVVLPGATEAVVPEFMVFDHGVTAIHTTSTNKLVIYPTHIIECSKAGTQYRLPSSQTTQQERNLEIEIAEIESSKVVKARGKESLLNHQYYGHHIQPPLGVCDACDRSAPKPKSTNCKLPHEFEWDNALVISADFIIPEEISANGNTVVLSLVTQHGVGAAMGLLNKTAKTTLEGLKECLRYLRVRCGIDKSVFIRLHTDMDKSFMAEVAAYARDNAWLQTH